MTVFQFQSPTLSLGDFPRRSTLPSVLPAFVCAPCDCVCSPAYVCMQVYIHASVHTCVYVETRAQAQASSSLGIGTTSSEARSLSLLGCSPAASSSEVQVDTAKATPSAFYRVSIPQPRGGAFSIVRETAPCSFWFSGVLSHLRKNLPSFLVLCFPWIGIRD